MKFQIISLSDGNYTIKTYIDEKFVYLIKDMSGESYYVDLLDLPDLPEYALFKSIEECQTTINCNFPGKTRHLITPMDFWWIQKYYLPLHRNSKI